MLRKRRSLDGQAETQGQAGKRQRNYKAEYKRRQERGAAKGLSRKQARGHGGAGRGEKPDGKLVRAYAQFRNEGGSAERAARENKVAPERLREFLKQQGAVKLPGGRWAPLTEFYAEGRHLNLPVPDPRERRLASDYLSAVKLFRATNDAKILKAFENKTVTDARDVVWTLETHPGVLRLLLQRSEPSESIYLRAS